MHCSLYSRCSIAVPSPSICNCASLCLRLPCMFMRPCLALNAAPRPQPPRVDVPQRLKHIALKNHSVKRNNGSGYSANFVRRFLDNGYEVGRGASLLQYLHIACCLWVHSSHLKNSSAFALLCLLRCGMSLLPATISSCRPSLASAHRTSLCQGSPAVQLLNAWRASGRWACVVLVDRHADLWLCLSVECAIPSFCVVFHSAHTVAQVVMAWQGLKVFEGYEQDPDRDIDITKFSITDGQNLTRNGVVSNHWQPLRCADPGIT